MKSKSTPKKIRVRGQVYELVSVKTAMPKEILSSKLSDLKTQFQSIESGLDSAIELLDEDLIDEMRSRLRRLHRDCQNLCTELMTAISFYTGNTGKIKHQSQ
jgi:hypothetical protein